MLPKEILFGLSDPDTLVPLFRTQKELAKEIFEENPEGFGSIPSLQSYLSLVLSGKKPISQKLETAIFSVLEKKVGDPLELSQTKKMLNKAFRQPNQAQKNPLHKKDSTEDLVLEKFNKMISLPGHHVIISDNLLELLNTQPANETLKLIFQNIGVLPRDGEKHDAGFRYEYYVKDLITSTSLWKNFYYYLREHKGFSYEEAQETMATLNREEKIRIFYTQPYIACQNLYLHNIKREKPQGFRVYQNREKICKVPKKAMENLLYNLYLPLKGTLKNREGIVQEERYGDPSSKSRLPQ